MTHKYHVHCEADLVGSFDTFAEARECYLKYAHAFGWVSADGCDYATDTGWFDGLTEEERDQL